MFDLKGRHFAADPPDEKSQAATAEFHFEDPDLKSSTLETGFPSCAIEKDNFTYSQGKQIRTDKKESFQAEVRKQRVHWHICVVVAVAVLVAKGPYC